MSKIYWTKRKRPGGQLYYSGNRQSKYQDGSPRYEAVGWAIRTNKEDHTKFWIVQTGLSIQEDVIGGTGFEIGPFDSLEIAKVAAEVTCTKTF